ncbi:hypothetical protein [Pseudomonas aeruginosa]|uniref:hypothetical protein n=1 Tax=Pseudomonas aeruginosa TaxID=287 RepID=UPI001114F8C0|nr:hypothetical protein [Pseudomonas aeruginosa]MDC3991729.1 hypothetical protein [Pseudomonas aeruginosa]MDY1099545.1 hypothetical protein [Pseudomonas aeruginosa]MDY1359496.1 hypothetical protein [Pseudomonas aeruginosa]MEE2472457.1 hypothetical protein [Pseudomonas aeruginosa]HBN8615912.1 hypothetical protein [Pseudomonas aeruginosa]
MSEPLPRLEFDPEWTVEEAIASGSDGPLSPFFQWAGWQQLGQYQQRYELGNKQSLFAALRTCACHGLPMPEWLAKAFCKSHDDWLSYRKPTLDEAFDVAIPKGAHINKLRKLRRLNIAIPIKVEELRTNSSDGRRRAIDEALFNDVGAAFSISGSQARDIYYKSPWRNLFQENPEIPGNT